MSVVIFHTETTKANLRLGILVLATNFHWELTKWIVDVLTQLWVFIQVH